LPCCKLRSFPFRLARKLGRNHAKGLSNFIEAVGPSRFVDDRCFTEARNFRTPDIPLSKLVRFDHWG
jgi:hypothetical protein